MIFEQERCSSFVEELDRKSKFLEYTYDNVRKAADETSSMVTGLMALANTSGSFRANIHALRVTTIDEDWRNIDWTTTEDES